MAFRTSAPKPPTPSSRVDSSDNLRLDAAAEVFLAAGVPTKLLAKDRAAMIKAIENRPKVASVSEKSDDYICARYSAMRADAAGGIADPSFPPDGMAEGSTVRAEVLGDAKEMRTKQNLYLCYARTVLTAAANGKMLTPSDVEDLAQQLAKSDPLGKFTK